MTMKDVWKINMLERDIIDDQNNVHTPDVSYMLCELINDLTTDITRKYVIDSLENIIAYIDEQH